MVWECSGIYGASDSKTKRVMPKVFTISTIFEYRSFKINGVMPKTMLENWLTAAEYSWVEHVKQCQWINWSGLHISLRMAKTCSCSDGFPLECITIVKFNAAAKYSCFLKYVICRLKSLLEGLVESSKPIWRYIFYYIFVLIW